MSGYVRIHRTLIGHPAFRNDAEAMAFAWLVAKAAWKPTRVRYKERGIYLDRGQLTLSVRDFAAAMDRDKAWVERLLKRLRSETMVETVTEMGVTLLTICNYNQYQTDGTAPETQGETPPETEARQTQDTEQEGKKGRKKVSRAAPVALPDWMPLEEWEAFKRMRRAMRVPFTADAETGIINDLERLRAEGHCPAKLLRKAVTRSWRAPFGADDTKATHAAKPQKPMTPDEIRSAIRFNRESPHGDPAKVPALEAQLSALTSPMASNVHRLAAQIGSRA